MASPTHGTAPPALAWDKLIRDLSPEVIRRIGQMLSIDGSHNYRDLAGHLGFTVDEVYQFDMNEPSNPGHALLRRWGQKANRTARVLKHSLSIMERQDVIRILEAGLSEPVDLVVVLRDEHDQILYDGVIHSCGQATISEALRNTHPFSGMFDPRFGKFRQLTSCDSQNVFDSKVISYKGAELSLRQVSREESPLAPIQETSNIENESLQKAPQRHYPHSPEVRQDTQEWQQSHMESQTIAKTPSSSSISMSDDLQLRSSSAESDATAQVPQIQGNFARLQVAPERRRNLYTKDQRGPPVQPKPSKAAPRSSQLLDKKPQATGVQRPVPDDRGFDKSLEGPDYLTTDFTRQRSEDSISQLPGYHEEATNNNIIENIFLPHRHSNNCYIVRPSRENPHLVSISVIFHGEIINYRVHSTQRNLAGQRRTEYFVTRNGPTFESVGDAIDHYKYTKIIEEGENDGPKLSVAL